MIHAQQSSNPPQSTLFNPLAWRCVGPPRGGRVVAGDPVNPVVFYFGACAGGVWKTDDGGTYWSNVSDGYFRTASVGAMAVADSDPNVIMQLQQGKNKSVTIFLQKCPDMVGTKSDLTSAVS
jgi:hypothetical protein